MPSHLSFPDLESCLDCFEHAWRSGAPPNIDEYLSSAPSRSQWLDELIQLDLEYRWRRFASNETEVYSTGDLPTVPILEDYFTRYDAERDAAAVSLELIAAEYRVRKRFGDRPELQSYLRRFPQYADTLPGLLERVDADVDLEQPELDEDADQQTQSVADAASSTNVETRQVTDGQAAESEIASHPALLGKYEIHEELGSGGMGRVFKAWDPDLHQFVVVKVIRSGSWASPQELEYFSREGRALAQVKHPHVLQVFTAELSHEPPFIVMELLTGGDLGKSLADFKGDVRRAVSMMQKIAAAVQAIHDNNLLHRDLKPSNVLLDARGEPKVSDFGLVKFIDDESAATKSVAEIGTPPYMAPEQVSEGVVDRAADIWALGVMMYQLLTGVLPFQAKGRSKLYHQICHQGPRSLRSLAPQVDTGLAAVAQKCLQKEPTDRFESAGELVDELQRWLDGDALKTHPDRVAQKLSRSFRRRPLAAGAFATVICVTLLAAPVRHFFYYRELWAMQSELAAGNPVKIVGDGGYPSWYEPHEPDVAKCDLDDGFFVVESLEDHSLVDLIKDPQWDEYVLEAELRHLRSTDHGQVGLYFMHNTLEKDPREVQFCICLTFNEWFHQAIPGPGSKIDLSTLPEWLLQNSVEFQPILFFGRGHSAGSTRFDSGVPVEPLRFMPKRNQDTWRKIQIRVDGEAVHASFDERPLPSVLLEDLQVATRSQFTKRGGSPDVRLQSRGPVGLFVQQGKVSVRNLSITPSHH